MTWSLQNGLIMTKQLGKAFHKGTFIIVPVETASNNPATRLVRQLVHRPPIFDYHQ